MQASQFRMMGPVIDGAPVLEKHGTRFVPSKGYSYQDKRISDVLDKIATALDLDNFAEAAIRFAHIEGLIRRQKPTNFFKANFNPSQPRNAHGEWSESGYTERASEDPKGTPSVGWCKIVKELCIAEATDVLPTSDYGVKFFRALNACMDRHNCLGVA